MKRVTVFLGIGLVALLCVVLFPQIQTAWLWWYNALGSATKLTVDLVQVGFIAVLFATVLVPFESLGWWAGWYGDKIKTRSHPGFLPEVSTPPTDVARYVIYLDTIGQASFQYLPEGETFLNELAATLPDNIVIVRGLMPNSFLNRPLSEDRMRSLFWRLAQRQKRGKSGGLSGALLSLIRKIRDLFVVAISADQRYGPNYNQQAAQIIYNSLIDNGYQPGSGVPITLIGVSGGGQIAMGALSYLKQSLPAPIEVISLSGVLSGTNNVLKVSHLYHLVGGEDLFERLCLILFPKRWRVFFLSYWNRAKRRSKVSFIPLGPVDHMGAGGPLDANSFLPDGRSFLRQTVDIASRILREELPSDRELTKVKLNNYKRAQEAPFNRPEYYPLNQSVNPVIYRPIAIWMGRLILPPKEQRQFGVLFEVHHADIEHMHLVGRVVYLQWHDDPESEVSVQAMTKDVYFNEEALYSSKQGNIHPIRLNNWRQVTPLESLAGARPNDDVVVMLREPVTINEESGSVTLHITSEPVQISGRFYGLVKFLQPIKPGSEKFQVVHFNRASGQFDGIEEVVLMQEIVPFEGDIYSSTNRGIEKSPLNPTGWYIYGAKNAFGQFVVQSLAPRALLRVQPEKVIFGRKAAIHYLRKLAWRYIKKHKGQIQSVLLNKKGSDIQKAVSRWREGDQALVVHVFGGIGGKKREPAARIPLFYFGHCAYGVAEVVREPLTGELRFEIAYNQIYTHNVDGIIAGTLSWTRYMGDRQFGWLGLRPVTDILIKFDAISDKYSIEGVERSPLSVLTRQLEVMTARYRIGDGTGGAYVGPANNCSQDANQSLYAAIKVIHAAIKPFPTDIPFAIKNHPKFKDWLLHHPEQATSFKQLVRLGTVLRRKLLPFGVARADWQNSSEVLGSSIEDNPLQQLFRGLISWRTLIPRKASDTVTKVFLQQGASVWILSSSQVGGSDPDIAAVPPFTF
ncbi:MAG: CAAX protease [Scytonema sp. PMC 1069.18]|nr:CAAX protease [Scytonema sp. PMC 1069.18]MEC4879767.1 CAAX protease [Scytonema sp. PMC 1070.18]